MHSGNRTADLLIEEHVLARALTREAALVPVLLLLAALLKVPVVDIALPSAWAILRTVRAARGGEAPLAFSYVNQFCMGLLYGRAERLNTKNAGFRPGQFVLEPLLNAVSALGVCAAKLQDVWRKHLCGSRKAGFDEGISSFYPPNSRLYGESLQGQQMTFKHDRPPSYIHRST